MEGLSDQRALKEAVLEASVAKTWRKACQEWQLESIFSEPSQCVCGHFIVDNCIIENIHNGETMIVGNVCVRHFDNPDLRVPKSAYASLKNIEKAPEACTANAALLDLAVKLNIIEQSQMDFYEKITSGFGCKKHYDKDHEHFSLRKYIFRRMINNLIKLGCRANRPRCKTCDEFMMPKRRRDCKNANNDYGYFYVCCGNFEQIK